MIRFLLVLALAVVAPFACAEGEAIDVHAHLVLPEYVDVLKKHGAQLEEGFPLPAWDVASHVKFMETAGISCSVLTMPAPQPWFGDKREGRHLIRKINEKAAQIKKNYPGKFQFCAALPLPDIESAIQEAEYALDVLHADGVKLASNSRGLSLGDARLDPLMEVLNKRHAVIIIHPHRPSPCAENAAVPLPVYEYPAETTRCVVNMIARNVLVRYPNLRVVVPHCGSFLPLALPRMQALYPAMRAKGLMPPIDWEGSLARLYYDLAGNPAPEVVKMLLTITSPDHLLYGSDFPYQPGDLLAGNLQHLRAALKADAMLAPYADDILHGNAVKLFSRHAGQPELKQAEN